MAGLVLGIAGLVVGGISAGVSFHQAGRAKKKAKDADRQAQIFLDRARKNVVDRYATLGISKQPYKQESDALISAGANLTEASAEGDQRGVSATAGKIQAVQTNAQAGVRDKMTKDIQGLEQVQAEAATAVDERNEAIELGLAQQQFGNVNAYNTEAAQSFQAGVNATGQALTAGIGAKQAYGKGSMNRAQRQLNKQLGGERGSNAGIETRFKDIYSTQAAGTLTPENASAYNMIKSKGAHSPQFTKAWQEVGQGTYAGGIDSFLDTYFTADDLQQMGGAFKGI